MNPHRLEDERPRKGSAQQRKEVDICGDCGARFSYLDYAEPAEALREHKGVCPRPPCR